MIYSKAIALALLTASQAALVTQVVYQTEFVYENINVFVNENGAPLTTVVSEITRSLAVPTEAPAPANSVIQLNPAPPVPTSVSPEPKPEPAPEPAPAPAPEPQPEPAPEPAPAPAPEPAPAPAPEPTPAPAPEPAPAPAPAPEPAPEPAPAPAQKTTSTAPEPTPQPHGEEFEGEATYYDVGLGACGTYNSNTELVAALNVAQMGPQSNGNPVCGRKALLEYNGKSVTVEIVDKCPGCAWGDLDLSPAAFDAIADQAQGRVPIKWSYIS